MTIAVRPATPDDAEAIAAIYRPSVEGVISFEETPPDAAEMARRMAETAARYPYFVAVLDGRVAGYAYAGAFRARAAYRWAVETTVYVDEATQRRGVGRTLLEALLAELEARGFVTALAIIALPNAGSVALHEALGFGAIGVERGVGWKHGRWHDVGVWQRELARPPDRPSDLIGLFNSA